MQLWCKGCNTFVHEQQQRLVGLLFNFCHYRYEWAQSDEVCLSKALQMFWRRKQKRCKRTSLSVNLPFNAVVVLYLWVDAWRRPTRLGPQKTLILGSGTGYSTSEIWNTNEEFSQMLFWVPIHATLYLLYPTFYNDSESGARTGVFWTSHMACTSFYF